VAGLLMRTTFHSAEDLKVKMIFWFYC
jgi:hypothetical protein